MFARDEVETIIFDARIPADRQMVYALELLAGVRPGEAAALRWRYYDPTVTPLGKILVAKSYNTRGNIEKTTKTDAVKHVPVHPVLAAMLAQWRLSGWPEMMGRAPGPDDLPRRRRAPLRAAVILFEDRRWSERACYGRRHWRHVTDSRRPFALIIGIAEYMKPRLRLATPVRDAEALAALLEQKHGYEIKLVRDHEASNSGLRHLFEVELSARLDEARPVLVYFAGHGTATASIDEPRGYLVPADGGDQLDSLLPMDEVARALRKLPCRHLLLVLDCCFAGAFRWSASRDAVAETPPTMYRERYELFLDTPAWQVITSAAHDEQAADVVSGMAIGKRDPEGETHSPFLHALLRGLGGEADMFPRNADGTCGDGVITATELYLYLRHELASVSALDRRQTPGLWLLPKHRQGEYIFHVPSMKIALPDAPTLSRETSPYRGFEVYEEEHAELFCGRRAVTEELRQQVEGRPITVVVGSSGTGKSSLVRAGLVPALRKTHPDWQIIGPIRPGNTPLDMLETALASQRASGTTVLVVDQLEELFAIPDGSVERTKFFQRLLDAASSDRFRVVGTLRADLETELWSSPLGKTWEHVRYPLREMSREELREAIEIPAEQKVITFDPPTMIDRLVNTVVAMPGALPLLSFTLHKHYVDHLKRGTNDRKLIELDETGAGGIALALREHTDLIYARLDAATRDTMRRLLLRMVTVKSGSITRRQVPLAELDLELADNADVIRNPPLSPAGVGQHRTRRQISLLGLVPGSRPRPPWFMDPEEQARMRLVLDALTGRASAGSTEPTRSADPDAAVSGVRLAVLGGTREDGGFVELAHDAVARDWPQFRAWLRDAFEDDLVLQRAVTASAAQWVRSDRNAGYLWRDDPRLPQVESRLLATPHQLNQVEAEFVLRSRAARRHRRAVALGALALFVTVVSTLAVIARGQATVAEHRRREAVEQTEIAQAQRELANARAREQRGLVATMRAKRAGEEDAAVTDGVLSAAGPRSPGGLSPSVREGLFTATAAMDAALPLRGHRDGLLSAVWSPDGRRVLTTSRDRTARIWDVDSGKELLLLVEPRDSSWAGGTGEWSPDGGRVVTAGLDDEARIWDAGSGRKLFTLEGHRMNVVSATWSPDGRRVLTASWDRTARIWDADSGREVLTLSGHRLPVLGAQWSPDGRRVLTVSWDHTARIWDADSSRELQRLKHQQSVNTAQWSPDGRRVLTASSDEMARIWDADSGKVLVTLSGLKAAVDRAVWSPDGNQVLTENMSNPPQIMSRMTQIWDATSGKLLCSLDGQREGLWSPRGDLILTAGADDTARIWNASCGRQLMMLRGHGGTIMKTCWSPDGTRALTASADHTARIWQVGPSRETVVLTGHRDLVMSVAWSPDEQQLLTASVDRSARIWDARSGKELRSLEGHRAAVVSAVWSPDGRRVLTASQDQTARVWDPRSGKELRSFEDRYGGVVSAAWSADGRQVLTTSWAGTARIWDVESGKEIVALERHQEIVLGGTWSLDGKQVLTASGDGTARIWDAVSGKNTLTFTGHKNRVVSASWSPERERVLTASWDGRPRIWDAHSGQKLFELEGHRGRVLDAVWSPDGQRVLTAGDDNTARIWDASSGRELVALSGHSAQVTRAVWASDNQRVLTASRDDTVRMWDGRSGRELLVFNDSRTQLPELDEIRTSALLSSNPVSVSFSRDGTRFAVVVARAQVWVGPADDDSRLRRACSYVRERLPPPAAVTNPEDAAEAKRLCREISSTHAR